MIPVSRNRVLRGDQPVCGIIGGATVEDGMRRCPSLPTKEAQRYNAHRHHRLFSGGWSSVAVLRGLRTPSSLEGPLTQPGISHIN